MIDIILKDSNCRKHLAISDHQCHFNSTLINKINTFQEDKPLEMTLIAPSGYKFYLPYLNNYRIRGQRRNEAYSYNHLGGYYFLSGDYYLYKANSKYQSKPLPVNIYPIIITNGKKYFYAYFAIITRGISALDRFNMCLAIKRQQDKEMNIPFNNNLKHYLVNDQLVSAILDNIHHLHFDLNYLANNQSDIQDNLQIKPILVVLHRDIKNAVKYVKTQAKIHSETIREQSNSKQIQRPEYLYLLAQYKVWKTANQHQLKQLEWLNQYTHQILYHTFFSIINRFHQITALNNSTYIDLVNIYNHIKRASFLTTPQLSVRYFHDQTYNIYEHWGVIILSDVLKSLGFKNITGWTLNGNHINSLVPNTRILFTNRNASVRLVYDDSINCSRNAKVEPIRYTGTIHHRPDFRLDIFSKRKMYIGSIILDTKYKTLQSILLDCHRNGQLIDYRNKVINRFTETPYIIKFANEDNLLSVPEVIALYPGNTGNINLQTAKRIQRDYKCYHTLIKRLSPSHLKQDKITLKKIIGKAIHDRVKEASKLIINAI